MKCFIRADRYMEGRVNISAFDAMVEEAAALPRIYGFAPSNAQLYPSVAARKVARAEMFQKMDDNKNGYITLEEWVSFALTHITGKVDKLPKDILGGSSDDVTKEEFIAFIKKAVVKKTPENRELYYFLLKCFVDADGDKSGSVGPEEFDEMIEIAARAPRRFGLAPSSEKMFATKAERLAKRKEYFADMDTNGDGKIDFDEWHAYALEHIIAKAASL